MKNQILALTILATSLVTTVSAYAEDYIMTPQLTCTVGYGLNGDNTYTHSESSQNFIEETPTVYGGVTIQQREGEPSYLNWAGFHVLIDHVPFDFEFEPPTEKQTGFKCHVEYTLDSMKKAFNDLLKLPEAGFYKTVNSSKKENHWFFGTKTFPNVTKVYTTSVEIKKNGGYGYQNQEAIFNTVGWIVLGYEIESHWQDGSNGNWTSINERVIGTGSAVFDFHSKISRGMSFTVKVYYIPGMPSLKSNRGVGPADMWTMG